MSNVGNMEPWIHPSPPDTINGGFTLDDFGYDPELETPDAKMPDFVELNPEPAILAEYEEFFAEDGYLHRSMMVDLLGGGTYGPVKNPFHTRMHQQLVNELLTANERKKFDIPLPPVQVTKMLVWSTVHGAERAKKKREEAGHG